MEMGTGLLTQKDAEGPSAGCPQPCPAVPSPGHSRQTTLPAVKQPGCTSPAQGTNACCQVERMGRAKIKPKACENPGGEAQAQKWGSQKG